MRESVGSIANRRIESGLTIEINLLTVRYFEALSILSYIGILLCHILGKYRLSLDITDLG